jgi:NADH-quinone oxidoreductase subunit M
MVAMKDGTSIPWLLAGIPLLGAVASLALWPHAGRVKLSSLLWSLASLGATIGFSARLAAPPEGHLALYLVPLAAAVSVLGQPVHKDHRLSWIMTLVCLGLGLGALTGRGPFAQLPLTALFVSMGLLLYRHHSALWPISWWAIGLFGLGVVCTGLSFLAIPPLSSLATLLTCAILLPLVPVHEGYLTALTRLPGGLPSFIVVVLPAVGLHGLATALPTMPDVVSRTVSFFAATGALYGAIKALAQSRVRLVLAYGSLSFFSALWWLACAANTVTPKTALLASAIGLATSGLLLSWQVIRTRYGDDVDPQAISGLAWPMPRYAVLVSLLALAAMGLPPFGVYAGFMALLLTSPLTSAVGLVTVLIAWLAASWYIMQTVQQLLFGARRSELRYTDALPTELASLMILVLALLALGLAPAGLLASDPTAQAAGLFTGLRTWNR